MINILKDKKMKIFIFVMFIVFVIILALNISYKTTTVDNKEIVFSSGEMFDLNEQFNLDNNEQIIIENQEIVGLTEDKKLIGYKSGTTIITIVDENNKKRKVKVTIKKVKNKKKNLSLDKTQYKFDLATDNKTIELIAKLNNKDIPSKSIKWVSTNEDVATVSNGIVTAKSVGTTIITANFNDKAIKCSITVIDSRVLSGEVAATGIIIDKDSYTLDLKDADKTLKLNVTILPSNTTNKKVLWSSSNINIASVDENGLVLAKKTGLVTITAITLNGIEAKAEINIKDSKVKEIMPISITFDKNSYTINLNKNKKISLNVTIFPSNATNKTVSWTSSNKDVATVSNGLVIAKAAGTTIITAKTSNGKTAQCTITVMKQASTPTTINASSIRLNKTSSSVKVGSTVSLIATISPSSATNKTVSWTSSNTNVATVSNGSVTAKASGTAIITAKTSNGKTAQCTITVMKQASTPTTINASSIRLNKTSSSVKVGSTVSLIATISPSNATNKTVSWTSSNKNVATVSNGLVTAKASGTTIITAKTSNGKTAQCTINVTAPIINAASISINQYNPTIYLYRKNNSLQLTATISPGNATNKTVSWASSNTNVATVSNGLVTAKFPGTTTITAKTSNGKVATTIVTVRQRELIIIGASQVGRMYKSEYSYISGNNAYKYNQNLHYIYEGGSGMDWQTGNGWTIASSIINKYSGVKNYVEFYIYFPLVGNTIANFSCDKIENSNEKINKYAQNYNNRIQQLKNKNYKVYGYVVSMHPVKPGQSTKSYVVSNSNVNSCKADYRSNKKYYKFNKTFKKIVESNYSSNLRYESLFTKIMNVSEDKYTYKVPYNTTDGVHWDEETTKYYIKLMLDYNGNL